MNHKTIKVGLCGFLTILIIMSIFALTQTKLTIVSTRAQATPEVVAAVTDDSQSAAVIARRNRNKPPIVNPTPTSTPVSIDTLRTMAWLYPGNPACDAQREIADGRTIHTLKAEYFTINGGFLTLLDTTNTTCNGFSLANVALLKQHATEQFITISSSNVNDMDSFLTSAQQASSSEISTLVAFVVTHNVTGIELDFEDFGSWTPEAYTKYKKFVTSLGNALHARNKKLMIDGPAISNSSEENWFVWRYRDFVNLPVDHMVVMAYDYQYDYGAGSPVAPLNWLTNVINWTSTQYPKEKITIGLPSYGYQGVPGSYRITILTNEQIRTKPGFATALRDTSSGEMTWQSGTTVYFYQDSESLRQKRDLVRNLGISSISIWHLGGNNWF